MAEMVNSGSISMNSGLFLMLSTSLSFWLLIYNAEFNSNSSRLDRLNNFGINSLQKLQN